MLQMGLENKSDFEQKKDRQFVTALARGLEVLRSFKTTSPIMGNKEIAESTGLPKPTVSRLTHTLTALGYLKYSETLRKYQLGTSILALGYGLLTNTNIVKVARPLLQELADYANTNVGIGVQDRLSMVYLQNVYPKSSSPLMRHTIGDRIPIATTSMGRAYLCVLAENERDYLMDQIRQRDEDNWPKIKAAIENSFKDYQELGFCLSIGEYRKDVNAAAVPIKSDQEGADIIVINCGSAAYQLDKNVIVEDLGPRLVHLAHHIKTQTFTS